MRIMRSFGGAALVFLLASCGGGAGRLLLDQGIGRDGTAGREASRVDGPGARDLGMPSDALLCGTAACKPGEYCIHPCSGVGPVPKPFCELVTFGACDATAPACGCLSPDPCNSAGGRCLLVSSGNIVCGSCL